MSTQIFYNNIQVLSGQPTPLVGITDNAIKYNNRWGISQNISLQGQLTGCSYSSILSQQQRLLNIFSKDFQTLQIIESNKVLLNNNYNVIKNINFDNSSYVGILGYNISLDCYPEHLFSGVFGVLDPVDEFSFQETENKLLEITHRVSAKGINTSSLYSNSFDNAKNYVLNRTGLNSFIEPAFATYCTGASLCIDSFRESINRFDNTYSVEEKYVSLDMFHGGYGYIRETAEYSCDLSRGVAALSLAGEVKSCKNADLNTLRQKYLNYDVFSAAVHAYSGACGRIDLNPDYISSGVNEDIYTKTIGFNVQFDNNFTPKIHFDYSTDIQVGEDDITIVNIKGTIKGRGDLLNKYSLVQDYYDNQLNLFYLANESYKEFCNNNIIYPLRNQQLNYSVTKNPFLGEISVSTSYDNKILLSPEFNFLDYTLDFKPSLTQIRSTPLVNIPGSSCNSNYSTVSLGYANRANLSINGRAVASCDGNYASIIAAIKNVANSSLIQYGNIVNTCLEKNTINQSNAGKGLGFTFNMGWSFDAAQVASITPFTTINTLSLK